ncbi:hypothetical protein [Chromobacterium violaceum]|uniref:hypothetical protein n=1 Tax=Chromobacterium violaceum TaxID=536 RepID=UPI0005BCD785|nr:hypothetical protein [Chromobacterium violaceum]
MEPANLTQRQAIPDDEPLAFDIFEAAMRHYVDLTWAGTRTTNGAAIKNTSIRIITSWRCLTGIPAD